MTRRVTASAVRFPNIQTKTTLWISDITSTLITYQYYNKKPYRSYMSATDFIFHCAAEPTTPTFTKGQPTKERTGLARLSVHTHGLRCDTADKYQMSDTLQNKTRKMRASFVFTTTETLRRRTYIDVTTGKEQTTWFTRERSLPQVTSSNITAEQGP